MRAEAVASLFECSGATVVSIDHPRIAALAYFLPQSLHLPFQACEAIERIVEARGLQRFEEAPDGREDAAEFPLVWGPMGCWG